MAEKTTIPTRTQHGFWPSLFEPFWAAGQQIAGFFNPSADASRDDGAYHVTMELPGVEEKDVDVSVDGDVLTIKGEKKTEREEKKKDYYFTERSYGSFQRSFQIPADVDRDKIDAQCEKGVLTITMPRRTDASKDAKKIKVKST